MDMSKYEWERGTIKIPSKDWANFRTTLIKAWNDRELSKLERAKSAHTQLKAVIKGKRGEPRRKALAEAADRIFQATKDGYEIQRLVVEGYGKTLNLKGSLPKKKDLKILPTSKDAVIHFSDATIVLRNKDRTVEWDVGENNRACEHSRSHPMGQKFFALLAKIKWTRGTGGAIVGNDEYNRDAGMDYAGGGGNYVTAEYSQAKDKRDAKARAHTSYAPYQRTGFGRRW